MITYKEYIDHFTFDEEVGLLRDKVANLMELVTFDGASIEKTRQAFQDAVDDYLAWRAKYQRNLPKLHFSHDVVSLSPLVLFPFDKAS